MMMMDGENKNKKSGMLWGPSGGNEWPSKNSMAPNQNFFFEHLTYKNRSESLQNHPTNVSQIAITSSKK